jgi:ADP-heptose:LPS heptosyltransferase
MTERILFISATRIGDAVLSTGILSYILRTYPQARVTIACGPLVESLFQGVQNLDEIILIKKQPYNRHWWEVWKQVRVRNSIVSRLIMAKKRYIYGASIPKNLHKVQQNALIIGVDEEQAQPRLFLTESQINKAKVMIPDGRPVLAVAPVSNWICKTWPVENFIELIHHVTREGEKFSGWRVAVLAAPGEEKTAEQLFNRLPEDIRINAIAKGSPGEAAAYLSRCQFFIGNDSGLMHCAAAAGIPTLGLFGPTNHHVYAAYGVKSSIIRTPETAEDLLRVIEGQENSKLSSLMTSLRVEDVVAKLNTMPL